MLFRRFERMIDIFREAPGGEPPGKVFPFYLYYLRQVWPSFAVLLVVGLVASLIEVSLFSYLSQIIDLTKDTPPCSCRASFTTVKPASVAKRLAMAQ